MEKLPEVESAKALMTEAMTWSVMKWLREKKRVRKTADQANAALDQLSRAVKEGWTDGMRAAYDALDAKARGNATPRGRQKEASSSIGAPLDTVVRKVMEADDEAYRARMDAEAAFDEAERQLSTSLAREGCRKAIHCWDLHEKAIHRAEAVIRPK